MIHDEMKARRIEAGISMHKAGLALGITGEGYRLKELGRTTVTGAELATLARLYGMPLREAFPSYEPSEGERLLAADLGDAA